MPQRKLLAMFICAMVSSSFADLSRAANSSVVAPTKSTASSQSSLPKKAVAVGEVDKFANPEKVDGVPMTSTFAESYIGKRTIGLTSPITSVQNLLNRKPGVVAASAGPLGVRQHLRFRGFSDGAVTQEFDGVPLNNPFTGYSASRSNEIPVTLNNISGIKIYDGVNNPSVNGPQSLGGTINYIPKKPGKNFYVKAGLGGGSFSTFLWNATFNTGSLYGLRSYFSYNRQTTNGWVANSSAQNSNYYYSGILPYDNHRGRLSIYAIVNRNIANKPRSIALPLIEKYGYTYSYPPNLRSDLYKDTRLTFVLDNKNIISNYLTSNLKFYVQNNVQSELEYHNPDFRQSEEYPYLYKNLYFSSYNLYVKGGPSYDPEKVFGSVAKGTQYRYVPSVTTTIGLIPKAVFTLPDNLVTVGAQIYFAKQHDGEFYWGTADVPQISGFNDTYDEHDSRFYISPYVQDDIRLLDGRLHITPGLKYIYSHLKTREGLGYEYPQGANITASSSTSFVAPTFGINFRPVKPLSVYFSYGRNVRIPYAAETYDAIQKDKAGNYVVAPVHLKPEYVNDYEFGTRLHYLRAELSVKLYRENLTNIFNSVKDPFTGLRLEVNNGNELAQGIELGAGYDFGHLVLGQWYTYANYSLNTRKYEYATTYDVPGESVDGSNYSTINVGLDWDWRHLQAQLNGRYVGSRRLHNYVTGTLGKLTLPAYFVLDLGLRDSIPVHYGLIKSVRLSLTLDNLLNRQYFVYGYANRDYYHQYYLDGEVGMPRAVFGSISIKF